VQVEKLVFLDECGFASNLRRLYGWPIGGARCVDEVPYTRALNRSCLGAFSLPSPDNPTGLWALWQKLGAWNGVLFEAFLVDELLPHLPQASVLVLLQCAHPPEPLALRSGTGGRSSAPVPAALLTRLQPHRTHVELAQELGASP